MSSTLTIWCNAHLSDAAMAELRQGTSRHRFVISEEQTNNLGSSGPSHGLQTADVAFGQPDPDQSMSVSGLQWIQITSAGYTRYDREDFRSALQSRGATMTNSSSVYDDPCAQHLLAFMLAFARQLPRAWEEQRCGPKWAYADLRPKTRLLNSETVLILGYGAIARRLAELLAPFGAKLLGFRRRVRGDEEIPVYPMSDLPQYLGEADHLVNILPASPETEGVIDATVLNALKAGALFYNVGRGTTVDQPALIEALDSGRLAGAYLDVTDPEPLPADHPLWGASNCYITPHIAGGHADEDLHLVRHFLANLARFEAGEPLQDRIV